MSWRRRFLLVLKIVGIVALVLSLSLGGLLYVTFDGVAPLEDGAEVATGVVVVDGYVSCAALDAGEGRVVLVDACQAEDGALVRSALERMGRTPEDVVAVLMTHGHADHRGSIDTFANAEIYAHVDELPLLRGEVAARGPVPRLSGRAPPMAVDHAVTDLERITLGDLSVQVFHLPGHTDGSVAYLVGETLFLGDNAHGMEDGSAEPAPWIFSDDTEINRASLAALPGRLDAEGAVVTQLVFAHSAPLSSMEPLRELAERCRSH